MIIKKTLQLDKKESEFIRKVLTSKDIMCEDDTITHTVSFGDGIEMELKICGADEDNPWTEAVLFHNGSQVCCTEPGEDYEGEWECSYNDDTYYVNVILDA